MCFRYFPWMTLEQFDRMTFRELDLRLKGLEYRRVDEDFMAHWQAYLSFVATAKKKTGKKERAVYSTFRKFYDYKDELRKVSQKKEKPAERFAGIGKYL